ncbi:hypothetical protein LSAT2_010577 [Lamellibrachia satsuma]|nr:hypothetical protein LSAT2_010577 [Lamellibrachia satsuma]
MLPSKGSDCFFEANYQPNMIYHVIFIFLLVSTRFSDAAEAGPRLQCMRNCYKSFTKCIKGAEPCPEVKSWPSKLCAKSKLRRDVNDDKEVLRDWDFPFIHCTVDSDSGCLEVSVNGLLCGI